MQLDAYRENGYLLIPEVFSPDEAALMLDEMHRVIDEDCPRRILEKNGMVRSFFSPGDGSELFDGITRCERLVIPSRQLIGDEVYVHQSKLNSKHAMLGDWWDWHQDYTYWAQDDGMAAPDVLTAMIFLTAATEFNGPLLLIPGSHKAGVVDAGENGDKPGSNDQWFSEYKKSTSYMTALTADLKYTLKQRTIAEWAGRNGIFAAKGGAGAVLFFHGNVFHASANNLSPWDRHAFLITYNGIRNAIPERANPRPAFLANRDFTPLAI